MSGALIHPTVEAVIAIHQEVLAGHEGGTGIGSRELLESSAAAPRATMVGQALVTDPIKIAASYFYYLCSNHAFVDGNKRVALATCLVFLSENGLLPAEELDTDPWETLTIAVASSALSRAGSTAALRLPVGG